MAAQPDQRARYPSLAGKRVLVTGGASGIGAGLVEAFVGQGARVLFCDIADDAARAVVARLGPGAAHAPLYRRCDLTDVDAVRALVAEADAALGGLDVLINNAGNDDRHALADVTPAYWDDRMAVNLRHLFFAAQAAVPAMQRAGGGVILNFGSISWHLGLREMPLYQTAKAAIEGMTRALARDLGRDNIRVATVVPGNVQTPRQERWYTPEGEAEIVAAQCLDGRIQPADVAALVLFLASDDARMCTGHPYFIDAGWR
ncbi:MULTISPECIES: SDR family NAD(P)-dependent oxidoreductase [Methylobacterium]|jgi:NAD(P)-dependent dehydrogenase (short-subunit alcohol dehydrogenase family)|uniref:Short-chain dehydrogenase/reductase SDR n=1 Tax=Methylobacterium radiotolerans (strain ATCC 27329 / DSM 1819 / JCM 2831 / NBRC 15690 / NCIMB 10815 / 0-1) TaxID=426355 RepID=B1LYG4_METRJ|nr:MULTISPECIES: SDR family oxidoreductase [Methylobacterium]ACB27348.1 short-chain dehydrogenase/reductase SDR [Methylobacterium radiotolerans JCM 2831]KIU27813.1 3-oxoacyl-ACP reductase [Methylobacterium radiotolerans]KZB97678.1 D-xylose 1-dehydrogenase [Methylobacterium radiotolerans]MDE3748255.1 SDR family NAD(P)-dependent oxidoreductase [Methylobacterium radiotolerans]ONF49652.1 3-oxoacyl-ACP reductase [Methylobacterium radiotolerans]